MKNPLWSPIYDLVQEVDSLLVRAERFGTNAPAEGGGGGDASAPAPEAVAASPRKKAAFFKAYVATDDLVEVRSKLRGKLDMLKAALSEHLTEREAYLVLFPLVVMFDELVQNRFVAGGQGTWPALQTELYKIDDGGEQFYNTLDDILRKADTIPFIYEIFYFCLSNGFKGRYGDNLAKINEYKHRLETKIPHPAVPRKPDPDAGMTRIDFGRLPILRYTVVAFLVVGFYTALRLVAFYAHV